jgi:hypothetical protein
MLLHEYLFLMLFHIRTRRVSTQRSVKKYDTLNDRPKGHRKKTIGYGTLRTQYVDKFGSYAVLQ